MSCAELVKMVNSSSWFSYPVSVMKLFRISRFFFHLNDGLSLVRFFKSGRKGGLVIGKTAYLHDLRFLFQFLPVFFALHMELLGVVKVW